MFLGSFQGRVVKLGVRVHSLHTKLIFLAGEQKNHLVTTRPRVTLIFFL
jgi:hypothetical protein